MPPAHATTTEVKLGEEVWLERARSVSKLPKALQQFIRSRAPSRVEALAALRLAFSTGFAFQLVVVTMLGVVLRVIVGPQGDAPAVLERVLLGAALAMLPVAVFVAMRMAGRGGKYAALAGVTTLGVLLSTPGWFFVFAWLAGVQAWYLLAFIAILGAYYVTGLVALGRFATLALTESRGAKGAPSSNRKVRQGPPPAK